MSLVLLKKNPECFSIYIRIRHVRGDIEQTKHGSFAPMTCSLRLPDEKKIWEFCATWFLLVSGFWMEG